MPLPPDFGPPKASLDLPIDRRHERWRQLQTHRLGARNLAHSGISFGIVVRPWLIGVAALAIQQVLFIAFFFEEYASAQLIAVIGRARAGARAAALANAYDHMHTTGDAFHVG
jgi:hypothetical protein